MSRSPDSCYRSREVIRLDEGGSGEVIWTFSNAGTFEFACLIPGHYESGMHGAINQTKLWHGCPQHDGRAS